MPNLAIQKSWEPGTFTNSKNKFCVYIRWLSSAKKWGNWRFLPWSRKAGLQETVSALELFAPIKILSDCKLQVLKKKIDEEKKLEMMASRMQKVIKADKTQQSRVSIDLNIPVTNIRIIGRNYFGTIKIDFGELYLNNIIISTNYTNENGSILS